MIAPQWLHRLLPLPAPRADPMAAGLRAEQVAAIESEVSESVTLGKTVGAVILISRNGKLASYRAFGWQDREARIPMRKDSIFRVLSMTKSVTCAALMCLVDEGKLRVEDPVERYLPEFAGVRFANGGKPETNPKLWQLMAHSAGLVDAFSTEFLSTDFTLSDVARFAARNPLGYEPGAGWAYSNGGLAMVGRIVELVSGMEYERFVRRKIVDPAGMTSSYFRVPKAEQRRLTAIYRIADGVVSREMDDPLNRHLNYTSPENGLQTTALDLWRFYEMIRNGGKARGSRILSEKSARAMVAVQTEDRNAGFLPGMGYGYGFSLVTTPNGIFRNHSAGTFGHGSYYQTHGWVDPVKGITGILFCQNRADAMVVTDEVAKFVTTLGALEPRD